MTPYYQDKQVTIYNGDILDILPQLNRFDFIFADPPFNVRKNYGNDKDNRHDYYDWCRLWIDGVFDKLNDCGTFYLMTISRHLPKFYLLTKKFIFVNEIHWRNVAAACNKKQFWPSYQPILMFGKTKEYYFDTYAQTRLIESNKRWGKYTTEQKGQMLDYWDDIPFVYAGGVRHKEAIIKKGTNKKIHPAQMPEKLAHRMLLFSCMQNGIILDLFMGTGTLLKVAKNLGLTGIGIDVNEKYCELAVNRLNDKFVNDDEIIQQERLF